MWFANNEHQKCSVSEGDAGDLWFTRKEAYKIYNSKSYLVLDFETTNLEKGSALNINNHVVLAGWRIVDGATGQRSGFKHKFGDEYEQQELLEDIKSVDFIVAHNLKFEFQWLRRCGADLTKIKGFCTMLGKWVINGNIKKPLNLNAVAAEYNIPLHKDEYVSTLIKLGVCPSEIPPDKLLKYNTLDVDLCHWVFLKELAELNDRHQLHLALTRNLTATVLADIEFNGMTLDKERVLKEYNQAVAERADLDVKLKELVGAVNLASPKQLGEYLYDKLGFRVPVDHKGKPLTTASGKRPTGSEVLTLLTPTTPDQKRFLELYKRFNKVDSLLSKNLEFFKLAVEHLPNGKFFAQFNQGITKTHRLSSTGRPIQFPKEKKPRSVQFQNLPREYKPLFWAGGEDERIGDVDGSALEFRIAADLGDDPVARDEITNWVDVHSITANTLTRAGEPTTRQQAKASTFAPLFAGNGKTLAQKEYAKFFKQKYKGISTTQRMWCEKVLDNKELRTPYGMRFYWPNCKMSRSGYIEFSTEIHNFPVQGFATGEIIPIGLIHFWYRSKAYNSGITVLNTVHDSIICKFHKSKEEEFRRLSTQALTTDVYTFLHNNYHYEFQTALGVEIKVSTHWGGVKDGTKLNVFPDGRIEMEKQHV